MFILVVVGGGEARVDDVVAVRFPPRRHAHPLPYHRQTTNGFAPHLGWMGIVEKKSCWKNFGLCPCHHASHCELQAQRIILQAL